MGRPRCARDGRPAGGAPACDGRASEEDWFERTGVAHPAPGGGWVADPAGAVLDARSLEHLALPDGGSRWSYEVRTPGGEHELRTVLA